MKCGSGQHKLTVCATKERYIIRNGIRLHLTELKDGLTGLKVEILAIANLLGKVFLNYDSTSDRVIVSI